MRENIEGENNLNGPDQKETRELEQQEIIVESRAEAVRFVKEEFRRRLEERFGKNGEEPMDFHSPEHSETVAKDARAFLEIIRRIDPDLVAEKDLEEAEIEGWAHDLIQNSTKEKGKPRKRHRGFNPEDIPQDLREKGVTIGNERASADELLEELKKYRYPNGEMIFDDKEREDMAGDIAATYPEFDFAAQLPDGSKGLKVWQPYVTPDTRLVALALSIGDFQGDARISRDLNVFRERGNAEFRELNPEIGAAVAGGKEHIPQERRAEIAKAIMGWVRVQVGFIAWQKELFWEKIASNTAIRQSPKQGEILEALKREFSHFDANKEAAQGRHERVEARYGPRIDAIDDEEFRNILQEIGYSV